jgi:hypothetical protein
MKHHSWCSHSLLCTSFFFNTIFWSWGRDGDWFACPEKTVYLWNLLDPPQSSPLNLGLTSPVQSSQFAPGIVTGFFEAVAHALWLSWMEILKCSKGRSRTKDLENPECHEFYSSSLEPHTHTCMGVHACAICFFYIIIVHTYMQ